MDNNGLTGDTLKRVIAILDEVLASPHEQRASVLEKRCGQDAALRARIERMIDTASGDAFERPAAEMAANLIGESISQEAPDKTGQRIGTYRIERTLGMGGMGIVYLAERDDDQFKQRVALKLIRVAHSDEISRQRFLIERQILADLDHPNLARLLDGGVTDDGSPYIVMEYVDGVPITEYCDTNDLDIDARLKIFQTVCDVIDHAHRNLVIHRDLKPTNILVTPDGTVKLLDFGIAKLLDPEHAREMTLTRTDSSPLTPEYSSPEQLMVRTITTASDVYSLGVLLYTLLAGRKPYSLAGLSAADCERVVCEQMPDPPSAVSGPGRTRQLRGDLDSIVLMALRKEPERRYSSARELARDIERYRTSEPVIARPDSVGYRTRRFFRRNRVAVIASMAVVAALIVGLGAAVWQGRIAAQQRDEARAETAKRDAISKALLEIISLADPGDTPVDVAAGKQVLDYALGRVDAQFAEQPDMLASVLLGIGRGYGGMGDYTKSTAILERALRLNETAYGPRSVEMAEALDALGGAFINTGNYSRADSLHKASLEIRLEHFDEMDPILIMNYSCLGNVALQRERFEEGLAYRQKALDINIAVYGPDHEYTAISYTNVSSALGAVNQHDAAEEYNLRAIRIWENLGIRDPDMAEAYHNQALLASSQGRAKEAAEFNGKAIQIYEELKLEEGSRYANLINTQGSFLVNAGRFEEAEARLRESLAMNIAAVGEDGLQTGASHLSLSRALVGLGKYDEAVQHAQVGHKIFVSVFGADHLYTAAAQSYIGDPMWRTGAINDGRAALQAAMNVQRKKLPGGAWRMSQTLSWLADLDMHVGDEATAAPRLREAIELRRERYDDDSWAIAELQVALADCLIQLGELTKARDLLEVAVPNLTRTVGADDYRTQSGEALIASLDQM